MSRRRRDDGVILPLTLVIVIVLGAVIAAVATYASATLRYGQVVEESADRLVAANGAMDNALEALDRNASLCALTTLANAADGYEYDLLSPTAAVSTINGVNPSIRCRTIGGAVTGVEEFALILTGDPGTGARDGAILNVAGSNDLRKVIDGPVFMGESPRPQSVSLSTKLTIQDGDLWYGSPTCPGPVSIPLYPNGNQNVLITPAGYAVRCIETTHWDALFASARPSEAAVVGLALPEKGPEDIAGCTVWWPGSYSVAPAVANNSYNYFRSGDYYFASGNFTLDHAYALFGWPGPTGPGIPGKGKTSGGNDTLAENPCRGAWESDDDQGGATIFLGDDARITVGQRSALEVSGRDQAGRLVAVHALEVEGTPSMIHGDNPAGPLPLPTRLIAVTALGNQKQVSVQGLIWAPFASIELDNIANDAVAALTGGAVVSEIFLRASNSATNVLVSNGSTPADRRLEITGTAVSANGGETSVRAIVTYRAGDYALESRRVMCITPDDPDTSC